MEYLKADLERGIFKVLCYKIFKQANSLRNVSLDNWKEKLKLLIEKCESARHLSKQHLVNQRLIAKYRVTMKFQHNAVISILKFSTVILPVLVEY